MDNRPTNEEVAALEAELEATLNGEVIDPADAPAEPTQAEKDELVAKFLEKMRRSLRAADPMGQAVSEKARGAVVNGGRKTLEAKNQRDGYARHKRAMRRINPRYKLGRYTAPATAAPDTDA